MGSPGSVDPDEPEPAPDLEVKDFDAVGEWRWPMALAVAAMVALTLVPPALFSFASIPVFPLVVGALLAVLIVGDPGRIDRRSRRLRDVSFVLVGVLIFGAIAGTVVLVVGLVNGSPDVTQAGPLLIYGAKVWIPNTPPP